MKTKLILIHILTATILFLSGCGDTAKTEDANKTGSTNKTITAKATADSYEVRPGAEVVISAQNSDTAGSQVTYSWINTEGQRLGTSSTLRWTAPSQEGNYSIILILNFNQANQSTDDITITVKADATPPLTPMGVLQDMIKRSSNHTLQDVTYICIGDSTRVYTTTPENFHNVSRHIFEDINASLINYHVTSYLVAQGGLMYKTFNGDLHYLAHEQNRPWIHVQEAIDHIPGDGSTTIVDMSMGSNDFSAIFHTYPSDTDAYAHLQDIHDEIKSQMMRTINTIKASKPKTKFMLTSTNPFKNWKTASDTYMAVYKEVASELNLPFANFVDDIMPPRGSTEFDAWYLDGIHFNDAVGLPAVSHFILEKILPNS